MKDVEVETHLVWELQPSFKISLVKVTLFVRESQWLALSLASGEGKDLDDHLVPMSSTTWPLPLYFSDNKLPAPILCHYPEQNIGSTRCRKIARAAGFKTRLHRQATKALP